MNGFLVFAWKQFPSCRQIRRTHRRCQSHNIQLHLQKSLATQSLLIFSFSYQRVSFCWLQSLLCCFTSYFRPPLPASPPPFGTQFPAGAFFPPTVPPAGAACIWWNRIGNVQRKSPFPGSAAAEAASPGSAGAANGSGPDTGGWPTALQMNGKYFCERSACWSRVIHDSHSFFCQFPRKLTLDQPARSILLLIKKLHHLLNFFGFTQMLFTTIFPCHAKNFSLSNKLCLVRAKKTIQSLSAHQQRQTGSDQMAWK